MICPPCAQAGQLNTEANRVAANASPSTGQTIAKLAKKTHKDCPGGTWCDCQHVVGRALNELAIAEIRNQPKPDLEQSPVAVDDVSASE